MNEIEDYLMKEQRSQKHSHPGSQMQIPSTETQVCPPYSKQKITMSPFKFYLCPENFLTIMKTKEFRTIAWLGRFGLEQSGEVDKICLWKPQLACTYLLSSPLTLSLTPSLSSALRGEPGSAVCQSINMLEVVIFAGIFVFLLVKKTSTTARKPS